jgi:hypothetical protein
MQTIWNLYLKTATVDIINSYAISNRVSFDLKPASDLPDSVAVRWTVQNLQKNAFFRRTAPLTVNEETI